MDMLRPLHQAIGADYPEIWRTIAECIYIGLDDIPADQRVTITTRIADILRAELGGLQPYLPKADSYDVGREYRELYARFTGRNIVELAAESGICLRVLYKHFAALRHEEARTRQGDFFAEQHSAS